MNSIQINGILIHCLIFKMANGSLNKQKPSQNISNLKEQVIFYQAKTVIKKFCKNLAIAFHVDLTQSFQFVVIWKKIFVQHTFNRSFYATLPKVSKVTSYSNLKKNKQYN